MHQPTKEEVGEWLEHPITELFLSRVEQRRQYISNLLAVGAAYVPGDPHSTAERTVEHLARMKELEAISSQPEAFLESEDEDEPDGDNSSGPPAAGTA